MNWRLHWLEAEDDLTHWRAQISDEVTAAYDAISRLVILPQIDVLIQRIAGAVIPETGTMGQAYRPGLFSLTVDPDNRTLLAPSTQATYAAPPRTRRIIAYAWPAPVTARRSARAW